MRIVTLEAPREVADAGRSADRILETIPRAMHGIRREMRSGASGRLTVPQVRALLYVGRHPGASLGDVAAHLGVGPSTCSVLVDRLVRANLLDRTVDPAERRRIRLEQTTAGAALVAASRDRARAWLQGALAALPPDDLAALERAMDILEQIVVAREPGIEASGDGDPPEAR